MTFAPAIEFHRCALLRLVAMLFEASGMVSGRSAALTRGIRRAVLHVLSPAEAAGRRLVMILSLRIAVVLRAKRAALTGPIPQGSGERAPRFVVFDPKWRFVIGAESEGPLRYAKGPGPRIFFFDGSDPEYEPIAETPLTDPDSPIDATQLCRRLEALKRALENLPREARRMARMVARRAAASARHISPLRPGRPPGFRAKGREEVDEILRECHILALRALAAPDTS